MNKEERKLIAEAHFKEMQSDYVERFTKIAIENSVIHNNNIIINNNIEVIDSTTEKAILHCEKKPCVLNFASFTRPGGGFINGSIAQEEALCHVSNLYNILLSFKDEYDKNYHKESYESGIYENWAIYTPCVYFNISGVEVLADVITCPAPNYKVYNSKYTDLTNFYDVTLKSRIKYILDIAFLYNQKTLILGAFGCGVFGNDPYKVAGYFKELLQNYKFDKVIFAIPNSENGNYETFKKVFNKYE